MGTTCTALFAAERFAYSAHVGDSAFISFVRRDLSHDRGPFRVMQLVKTGELSMQQARHHPDKNVVTRCLGTQRASSFHLASAPSLQLR